jgi:hypothetical protein
MGRDNLADLGVDERILILILEKQDGRVRISVIWLGIGTYNRLL